MDTSSPVMGRARPAPPPWPRPQADSSAAPRLLRRRDARGPFV
uniref:Uncharacterized protein n=1 Tax=Arundo donax TaxID=35708 RepID=A0A0A9HDN2_ARUDO